ncbi:MAG: SLC13 family permease [Allosphingosinicella sp.]
MTTDLVLVLLLLAAAIVMFALNRPRMDVVALIMMAALPLTGVISIEQALAGLSDPSIVLIAAMFVIGDALVRTGVAQKLGDFLVRHAGRSETRLIALLMLVVAVVGSVMSSAAVVAIFIPVVLRIADNAGLAPGRLMMALSMAALLSGMMTLIATTPNLVVQSELVRRGHEGFAFFSITPFGVALVGLGIVYMLFARRLLRTGEAGGAGGRPRLVEWVEEYGLEGREHRMRVLPGSRLVGKILGDMDARATRGINIIAIERRSGLGRELVQPRTTTRLQSRDVIFFDLPHALPDQDEICRDLALAPLPHPGGYLSDRAQEIGMAEMIVPPGSRLVGKTVIQSRLRSDYDLTVLGLKHGRTVHTGRLTDETLREGDTLLVVGPWRAIEHHRSDFRDLIAFNLPKEFDDVVPVPGRAYWAIAVLALVVALMVAGVVPNVHAALIGCLLMGLRGCMDISSAYRSIHWQSLILIVGMLPFSIALQNTGGVALAADGLLGVVGPSAGRLSLAAIFIVTAVLGLFVSNTATAVLMAPVALEVADHLHASPYPFAMIVALAASAAFMTPVSSPVNTLVVGPGDYSFADFLRVGVPFTLLTLVVSVILVPLLLPL